ncbi:MAG: acyl-CoA synthetase [Alphaproteobacteria bacterium 13_2_20CM_2_64_7]|jgi:acyl-coenzyme A synthetase/AMP-(fatty) acid ligase|nr:MAG: acyl-CoA synthetase [Alphaproteobacteria bacterium 13_2_20CM_2_64_7]
MKNGMLDYSATYAAFRWEVPSHFNFGGDVVDVWAKDSNRLALIWCDEQGRERRFTFAEISGFSNRFANLLQQLGIGRSDRVLVMLPRLPEWQIAMVGCLKLGAIPIPCIDMLTSGDVAYRIEHSGARGAVTTAANVAKFNGPWTLAAQISVGSAEGWTEFEQGLAGCSDRFAPVRLEADEPAIIFYTSGSTGKPKGVTHASRALFAWRVVAMHWPALTSSDLMWCTADTGWSKAGTSILFGPWSCGAAVLFYNGRFDPKRRFELLAKYRVTVFCAAATELRQLVIEDVHPYDLSALRLAISAGETVNPEIIERWRSLIEVPLLDGYGLTETLMNVVNYPQMPVKPGSMGRPLPGTEIAVLDPENRPAMVGQPGRLMIRLPNPQAMIGYWKDPELSQAAIVRRDGDEWINSGDIVKVDEDGYVFYLGRSDDVINSAGYRIGPVEVENAVIEHMAVQECAVVGSPDVERGEIVKAFVVLRPGILGSDLLAKEIQEHVKRVTAPYKYPRKIEFVDGLPKTATGKIQRRVLRDREHAQTRQRTTQ